uniref:Putative secreted protein n=1 Tax=Psorophora albipes TaxID=869069 RepID=T1E3I5_9DIPT
MKYKIEAILFASLVLFYINASRAQTVDKAPIDIASSDDVTYDDDSTEGLETDYDVLITDSPQTEWDRTT